MWEKRKKKEVLLDRTLKFLEKTYHVPREDIFQLIKKQERKQKERARILIPISLFSLSLSSLEAMTVYLRDVKGYKFSEMEKILGRNQITLSTTYRRAKKKYPDAINIRDIPSAKYHIPCQIFTDKQLSVLEHIVFYLKIEYRLKNHQIAELLNKDPRTIWTVLYRAKQKKMPKMTKGGRK